MKGCRYILPSIDKLVRANPCSSMVREIITKFFDRTVEFRAKYRDSVFLWNIFTQPKQKQTKHETEAEGIIRRNIEIPAPTTEEKGLKEGGL